MTDTLPLPSRRVLLVSTSSGSQGGGELYLDMLAEGLVRLGHEVHTVLSSHPRMDVMEALLQRWGSVYRTSDITNTYDQRFRSLGSVLLNGHVMRLARRFNGLRPHVIHVNKQNVEDGLDVLRAASRSGVPTVCTVHVTRRMRDLGSAFGRVRDWLAGRALAQSRCEYITIAGACRRQLAAFLGRTVDDPRLHIVLNGVRSVPAGDREQVRKDWKCGPDDIVIGCVARLESQKNPLLALDLLAALPGNVHLAWVGDGRLRDEFVRKANQAGLAGRVHLDGWRTDARQRMAGFDVFLLPSLYEGLPFAVLEAMAAGLPCVASDVDGTREAITDGVTGWLCPPQDRPVWGDRLAALVRDTRMRQLMGRAGEVRVRESFSLEAMAQATTAVYDVAIRRNTSSRPLLSLL